MNRYSSPSSQSHPPDTIFDATTNTFHHFNIRAFEDPILTYVEHPETGERIPDAVIEHTYYVTDVDDAAAKPRRETHIYHCTHDQAGNPLHLEFRHEPLIYSSRSAAQNGNLAQRHEENHIRADHQPPVHASSSSAYPSNSPGYGQFTPVNTSTPSKVAVSDYVLWQRDHAKRSKPKKRHQGRSTHPQQPNQQYSPFNHTHLGHFSPNSEFSTTSSSPLQPAFISTPSSTTAHTGAQPRHDALNHPNHDNQHYSNPDDTTAHSDHKTRAKHRHSRRNSTDLNETNSPQPRTPQNQHDFASDDGSQLYFGPRKEHFEHHNKHSASTSPVSNAPHNHTTQRTSPPYSTIYHNPAFSTTDLLSPRAEKIDLMMKQQAEVISLLKSLKSPETGHALPIFPPNLTNPADWQRFSAIGLQDNVLSQSVSNHHNSSLSHPSAFSQSHHANSCNLHGVNCVHVHTDVKSGNILAQVQSPPHPNSPPLSISQPSQHSHNGQTLLHDETNHSTPTVIVLNPNGNPILRLNDLNCTTNQCQYFNHISTNPGLSRSCSCGVHCGHHRSSGCAPNTNFHNSQHHPVGYNLNNSVLTSDFHHHKHPSQHSPSVTPVQLTTTDGGQPMEHPQSRFQHPHQQQQQQQQQHPHDSTSFNHYRDDFHQHQDNLRNFNYNQRNHNHNEFEMHQHPHHPNLAQLSSPNQSQFFNPHQLHHQDKPSQHHEQQHRGPQESHAIDQTALLSSAFEAALSKFFPPPPNPQTTPIPYPPPHSDAFFDNNPASSHYNDPNSTTFRNFTHSNAKTDTYTDLGFGNDHQTHRNQYAQTNTHQQGHQNNAQPHPDTALFTTFPSHSTPYQSAHEYYKQRVTHPSRYHSNPTTNRAESDHSSHQLSRSIHNHPPNQPYSPQAIFPDSNPSFPTYLFPDNPFDIDFSSPPQSVSSFATQPHYDSQHNARNNLSDAYNHNQKHTQTTNKNLSKRSPQDNHSTSSPFTSNIATVRSVFAPNNSTHLPVHHPSPHSSDNPNNTSETSQYHHSHHIAQQHSQQQQHLHHHKGSPQLPTSPSSLFFNPIPSTLHIQTIGNGIDNGTAFRFDQAHQRPSNDRKQHSRQNDNNPRDPDHTNECTHHYHSSSHAYNNAPHSNNHSKSDQYQSDSDTDFLITSPPHRAHQARPISQPQHQQQYNHQRDQREASQHVPRQTRIPNHPHHSHHTQSPPSIDSSSLVEPSGKLMDSSSLETLLSPVNSHSSSYTATPRSTEVTPLHSMSQMKANANTGQLHNGKKKPSSKQSQNREPQHGASATTNAQQSIRQPSSQNDVDFENQEKLPQHHQQPMYPATQLNSVTISPPQSSPLASEKLKHVQNLLTSIAQASSSIHPSTNSPLVSSFASKHKENRRHDRETRADGLSNKYHNTETNAEPRDSDDDLQAHQPHRLPNLPQASSPYRHPKTNPRTPTQNSDKTELQPETSHPLSARPDDFNNTGAPIQLQYPSSRESEKLHDTTRPQNQQHSRSPPPSTSNTTDSSRSQFRLSRLSSPSFNLTTSLYSSSPTSSVLSPNAHDGHSNFGDSPNGYLIRMDGKKKGILKPKEPTSSSGASSSIKSKEHSLRGQKSDNSDTKLASASSATRTPSQSLSLSPPNQIITLDVWDPVGVAETDLSIHSYRTECTCECCEDIYKFILYPQLLAAQEAGEEPDMDNIQDGIEQFVVGHLVEKQKQLMEMESQQPIPSQQTQIQHLHDPQQFHHSELQHSLELEVKTQEQEDFLRDLKQLPLAQHQHSKYQHPSNPHIHSLPQSNSQSNFNAHFVEHFDNSPAQKADDVEYDSKNGDDDVNQRFQGVNHDRSYIDDLMNGHNSNNSDSHTKFDQKVSAKPLQLTQNTPPSYLTLSSTIMTTNSPAFSTFSSDLSSPSTSAVFPSPRLPTSHLLPSDTKSLFDSSNDSTSSSSSLPSPSRYISTQQPRAQASHAYHEARGRPHAPTAHNTNSSPQHKSSTDLTGPQSKSIATATITKPAKHSHLGPSSSSRGFVHSPDSLSSAETRSLKSKPHLIGVRVLPTNPPLRSLENAPDRTQFTSHSSKPNNTKSLHQFKSPFQPKTTSSSTLLSPTNSSKTANSASLLNSPLTRHLNDEPKFIKKTAPKAHNPQNEDEFNHSTAYPGSTPQLSSIHVIPAFNSDTESINSRQSEHLSLHNVASAYNRHTNHVSFSARGQDMVVPSVDEETEAFNRRYKQYLNNSSSTANPQQPSNTTSLNNTSQLSAHNRSFNGSSGVIPTKSKRHIAMANPVVAHSKSQASNNTNHDLFMDEDRHQDRSIPLHTPVYPSNHFRLNHTLETSSDDDF